MSGAARATALTSARMCVTVACATLGLLRGTLALTRSLSSLQAVLCRPHLGPCSLGPCGSPVSTTCLLFQCASQGSNMPPISNVRALLRTYRTQVKEAMRAHHNVSYVSCSDAVRDAMRGDVMRSVKELLPDVLRHIHVLLYQVCVKGMLVCIVVWGCVKTHKVLRHIHVLLYQVCVLRTRAAFCHGPPLGPSGEPWCR